MGSSSDDARRWTGRVSLSSLPGGGFHRKVRVTIDGAVEFPIDALVECDRAGDADGGFGAEGGARVVEADCTDCRHCEIVLVQQFPEGIYLDINEVKGRHDFEPAPGTLGAVRAFAMSDGPIDVEVPAASATPLLVGFKFALTANLSSNGSLELHAGLSIPVHFRYPHVSRDGASYATVHMAVPTAFVRCGAEANGGKESGDGEGSRTFDATSARTGDVSGFQKLRAVPEHGLTLTVPAGQASDRDVVVGVTVGTALLGCAVIGAVIWRRRPAALAERGKLGKKE
ncbi:unnamed protein product [Phaeothamnion confervicola]